MTSDELQEVLRSHKLWLLGDARGKKADLRSANLGRHRSLPVRTASILFCRRSFRAFLVGKPVVREAGRPVMLPRAARDILETNQTDVLQECKP